MFTYLKNEKVMQLCSIWILFETGPNVILVMKYYTGK